MLGVFVCTYVRKRMRMRKLTPYLKHPLIKVENAKVIYPSVNKERKKTT